MRNQVGIVFVFLFFFLFVFRFTGQEGRKEAKAQAEARAEGLIVAQNSLKVLFLFFLQSLIFLRENKKLENDFLFVTIFFFDQTKPQQQQEGMAQVQQMREEKLRQTETLRALIGQRLVFVVVVVVLFCFVLMIGNGHNNKNKRTCASFFHFSFLSFLFFLNC